MRERVSANRRDLRLDAEARNDIGREAATRWSAQAASEDEFIRRHRQNSDIEVGLGPWKWVKLDPRSLASVDLSEAELPEPGKVYSVLDRHSEYDALLTLNEILEDR